MLCFDLQNRLCPDWERGVWHSGAGWCAVPGAFRLSLKRSVKHLVLGWHGNGRAVRWLMQRAALGFAACSAGRCSVLRFLLLSCGLAGGEDCRSLFFLTHKRNAARWNPPRSISCFRPYGRVCARLWGWAVCRSVLLLAADAFPQVEGTLLEGVSDGEVITQ